MTGVAQRGRPQVYFDTNYFTVSQKLAELYSSASFYALLFAVEIPPNHVFIMRVYTILLYCTCSVSQRCKKTRVASLRRPFSRRNICPNFKWRVSQRGADLSYILIPIILLSLKNWLSYTARHTFMLYFLPLKSSQPCIHNACVYNPIVLYLLSVTALQKDEGCFPSATVF